MSTLAFHEAFRRLKFNAEDLFLGVTSSQLWLELRTQDKTFVATCGTHRSSEAHVRERWLEKVDLWNSNEAFAERVWKASYVRRFAMPFVQSLVLKGIKLPGAEEMSVVLALMASPPMLREATN